MQLSINPLQTSPATPGASIKKTQQSLLRSDCFITAMKRSAPMMNNSIDGAQPSVNSIQMTTARPGGRNSRLADRTADMRHERLLYFALPPSERVRGKPGGRRPWMIAYWKTRPSASPDCCHWFPQSGSGEHPKGLSPTAAANQKQFGQCERS